jgi:hypothetical protein
MREARESGAASRVKPERPLRIVAIGTLGAPPTAGAVLI